MAHHGTIYIHDHPPATASKGDTVIWCGPLQWELLRWIDGIGWGTVARGSFTTCNDKLQEYEPGIDECRA